MKSRLATMMKIAFGALLVLAVAAPLSASPITQAQINDLNTILISPNVNESLTSIYVNGVLTINFDSTMSWFENSDATGGLGGGYGCDSTSVDGGVGCQLIVSFNSPVTLVGLEAGPNTPALSGISLEFCAAQNGTDCYAADNQSATSAQLVDSPSGYWFFGTQEAGGIGSIVLTTNDSGPNSSDPAGLYVSDFQFAIPEPSTFLLLGAGLFGLGLVSRRRLAR